jgi:hypothetical protein
MLGGSNLVLPLLATLLTPAPEIDHGLPLEGEAAERFLATATIVSMTPVGRGVTRPQKVTLDDGTRVLHAIWKGVDELRHKVTRSDKGSFQIGFRDSYKYEIAAYELDKLLGLDLVPPTVSRRIDEKDGSLQMWVEGAFSEIDRQEKNLRPSNNGRWSQDFYKVQLLNQLIYNTDTQNGHNLLYDPDFRIYAIDHSRSFRLYSELSAEKELRRFSRSVLDRLRGLNRAQLEDRLGPWLSGKEIDSLLKRRDLIVELADSLVAQWGESVVLY